MLPDRVSNPGPLTYESGALFTALRGPANTSYMLVASHMLHKIKIFIINVSIDRLLPLDKSLSERNAPTSTIFVPLNRLSGQGELCLAGHFSY